MDLARARYLVSPEGRVALASLPPGLSSLGAPALATALRRDFAPAQASALAEQVSLRALAERRHGSHRGLLYTPAGLEMMTHPLVASRRAERVASLALPVADVTCGLGGDLLAISQAGTSAFGLERDAPTALLAAHNVPAALIARGDAQKPPLRIEGMTLIIDPSRRAGVARTFDPEAFSPPWDAAMSLATAASAAVVKAPPGLDYVHVPPSAEVESVQLGTSLRELALWFGRGAQAGLRRAVLLPRGVELTSTAPEVTDEAFPPGAFVYDPESCVTRAGLVRQLAFELGARMLDPQVAYLGSAAPAWHPMAATFEVLEVMPFSLSRLKQRLRQARWRPDEIRRRAFPIEPDELRKLLGKLEGETVTLLLTTIAGQRTVFIARRLFAPA